MNKYLTLVFTLLSYTLYSQKESVIVSYENVEDGIVVYAKNTGFNPFTVDISIDATNMISDDEYPKRMVINPSSEKQMVTSLKVENKTKGYQFKYEYTYYKGNAINTVPDNYVYGLPFEAGESFLMSQGYNGDFSHQGKNAIDFTMPVGTNVCASRAGIVSDVKEDSNQGCPTEDCINMANYITIYHEDGTFAEYTHLKKNGSKVKPGMQIKKGQIIGVSGETGFSSGPHLHFEIFYYNLSERITTQTTFLFDNNKIGYLEEMTKYKAVQ